MKGSQDGSYATSWTASAVSLSTAVIESATPTMSSRVPVRADASGSWRSVTGAGGTGAAEELATA